MTVKLMSDHATGNVEERRRRRVFTVSGWESQQYNFPPGDWTIDLSGVPHDWRMVIDGDLQEIWFEKRGDMVDGSKVV